ncbi:YkgB family protein [Pseudomonas sp.]|jgi:uncharacterized membrane protein YkgB|uniref:YkgB family protein n=1 Tax=Pseudomonas sp. TaxID=306 RepID=UPI002E32AB78|nr:DUF417 family protein [Pseudomonas sp.]HEX4550111.1 DUF417 family protein [Pseudomonas sp.]
MSSLTFARFVREDVEVAFMRWALVLVFFLFGYAKWFAYEAEALIPLISNSPLMSWLHVVFGIQGASYFLGVVEWLIALGLALGAWMPRVSIIASIASAMTFLVTLTMIFTTPDGWEASAGGFPAMGGASSFLLKDLILLAGSFVLLKRAIVKSGTHCKNSK